MKRHYGAKGLEVRIVRIDMWCIELRGEEWCPKGNREMEAEYLRPGLLITSDERCDPNNGRNDVTDAEQPKKARLKQEGGA